METSNIPTFGDAVEEIERRFVVEGAGDRLPDDLRETLADLFVTGGNGDLLGLLAFARGCHALAGLKRIQGDEYLAGLYFAIGQDLLAISAEALAGHVVVGNQFMGTVMH